MRAVRHRPQHRETAGELSEYFGDGASMRGLGIVTHRARAARAKRSGGDSMSL